MNEKEPRQSLPEGAQAAESFVLDTLRQVHGGKLVYAKLNTRRALLEAFWVRGGHFERLCIAINSLVKQDRLQRDQITTRPTERYVGSGYCNPASRQVTLAVAVRPAFVPSPSRHEGHFV